MYRYLLEIGKLEIKYYTGYRIRHDIHCRMQLLQVFAENVCNNGISFGRAQTKGAFHLKRKNWSQKFQRMEKRKEAFFITESV